jgi:2-haloacid dehalogenase
MTPVGHRDRMAGEELLALIFEQVHGGGGLYSDAIGARRPPVKWHNARPMALPSNVKFVTFDVYGTLIDWEKGVFDAFRKEAARDGFTIEDPQEVISRFHEYEREIEGGSYELYAEVLRRVAVRIAKDIGWPLEPSRAGFLPDSVARWAPFKETNAQLTKFGKNFQTGLVSNIDDKLLGQTRRHIPHDFDLVVTAQQVRSYKPDPAHFKECARRIGGKKGWVHIAASYYHDVEPCIKEKVPVIWVNRNKEELDPGQKKPTAEVRNLLEAAKLLGVS